MPTDLIVKHKIRAYSRVRLGKFGGHMEINFKGVRSKMIKLTKFASGRQAKNFRDAWVDECLTLIGDEMAETWRKQPGWQSNTKAWARVKQNLKGAGKSVEANKVGVFSRNLSTIVIKGGQTYFQTGGFMRQGAGTRGNNSTGFNIIATSIDEPARALQTPKKKSSRQSKYPVYFNREHRFFPTVPEFIKVGNQALANQIGKRYKHTTWLQNIKNKALLKGASF